MAGNHTLGTIRGTIEIDYDGAGIVRAKKDTDDVKSKSEGLEKAVDKVGKAFLTAGKRAAIMGATSLALSGAIHGIAAAISAVVALAPVALAGLATLPGVLVSVKAAIGIVQVAVMNMGDALKAASGDSAKFEEELKKLSPEAQAFARAWKASLPALQSVQKAIQNTFFNGLSKLLPEVVRSVQALTPAARGVASQFNGIARDALEFAGSATAFNAIRSILGGIQGFLRGIRPAIKPILAAFLGLSAQTGQFGETLGKKVGAALLKIANIVSRLDLEHMWAQASAVIQPLVGFLKDVWSILGSIFTTLNVDGSGALGIIGQLVSEFAAFLKTAEGQQALQAIGTAMAAISGSAGQVFLALLKALAPTIIALAPGVAELATQLAAVLVPAINDLAPLLVALAGFLSDNMSWLGPLALAIGTAAGAYKTGAAAVKAYNAVQEVLKGKLVSTLAQWAKQGAAVVANTAKMAANAAVVGGKAVVAWAKNTAAMAANLVKTAAMNVAVGVKMVASWARATAAVIANRVAMAAQAVWMGIVRAATVAWTAVQWLLNAALAANPIGLVVIAIALLVGAIILLWKKSDTFRAIVIAVWNAIKAAALAVVNWFKDTALPFLKKVWDAIVAGFTWLKDKAVSAFNLWWAGVKLYINFIKTIITTVWNAIVAFIKGGIARFMAIVNGISSLVGKFRSWFGSIVSAIKEKFDAAIALAKSLPGKVLSALGNVGSKLFNAGKSLIQGFIDGIKHMIGAAGNAAQSVIDKVTGFFPGSPAKEGPLSGHGYVLLRAQRMMQDMAKGIEKGSQLPVQATAGVVGGVGSSLDTLTGQRAAQPASAAAAAPTVVRVPGDGRTLTIENLNLRGVWDFTEPGAERRVVARLHESLDRYEKEHA